MILSKVYWIIVFLLFVDFEQQMDSDHLTFCYRFYDLPLLHAPLILHDLLGFLNPLVLPLLPPLLHHHSLTVTVITLLLIDEVAVQCYDIFIMIY